MFCSSSILQGGCRLVGAQVAQTTSACRLKLPPVGRGQFGTCCFCNACHGVDLQLPYKVKRGNLERKLGFGTCCSGMICSKSKTMFVWEAHLSTVKANKSCLTLLLYLECTADQLLRVQKLAGGVTWNASCLGT